MANAPTDSRRDAQQQAEAKRRKNNVQVGTQRKKYVYVDLTKHLLHDGEEKVEISALGNAISDAVAVAEYLVRQDMAIIIKTETSVDKSSNTRREGTLKISIWVKKSPNFDANYRLHLEDREARRVRPKDKVRSGGSAQAQPDEPGDYDEEDEEEEVEEEEN